MTTKPSGTAEKGCAITIWSAWSRAKVASPGQFDQTSPHRRDIERQLLGKFANVRRAPGVNEPAVDSKPQIFDAHLGIVADPTS